MQITGSHSQYIGNQTGNLGYQFSVYNSGLSGIVNIGFSGSGVKLDFLFKDSKIYDYKNRFVGTYDSTTQTTLSGAINPSKISLYIDNEQIYDADSRPTGSLKYAYFKSQNSPAEVEAIIYGEQPQLTISTLKSYQTGQIITGRITNTTPERTYRIFSGELLEANFTILSGLSTGEIGATTDFYLVPQAFFSGQTPYEIRFYTSFGVLDTVFTSTGVVTLIPNLYLNVTPKKLSLTNQEQQTYLIDYWNSTGTGAWIDVSLTYVSGQIGNIFAPINVEKSGVTGDVSGFISGFGQLTGMVTGIVSGYSVGAVNSWAIQTIGDDVYGALYRNIRWFSSGWGDARFNGLYEWVSDYIPTWQGGINFIYQNEKGMYFYQNNDDDALVLGTGYKATFYNSYLNSDYDPVNLPSSWFCSGGIEPGATGACPVGSLSGQLITGIGYGILSKDQYATGKVSFAYAIPVTGIGSGFGIVQGVEGAGIVYGQFSGFVPYAGGVLTKIFNNFQGTGTLPSALNAIYGLPTNVPYIVSGNIPSGLAAINAPFTGLISQYFSSGEYETLSLGFDYTVTGTVSKNWTITGTGYYITNSGATGIVDTNFIQGLKPGTYTFSKFVSGLGMSYASGILNPIRCSGDERIVVIAWVTGMNSVTKEIFTVVANDLLKISIPLTGTASLGVSEYGVVPAAFFPMKPLDSGELRETSANLLTGGAIRTNTSRYQTGRPNSGAFSEPFSACNYFGYYVTGTSESGLLATGFGDADTNGFYSKINSKTYYKEVIINRSDKPDGRLLSRHYVSGVYRWGISPWDGIYGHEWPYAYRNDNGGDSIPTGVWRELNHYSSPGGAFQGMMVDFFPTYWEEEVIPITGDLLTGINSYTNQVCVPPNRRINSLEASGNIQRCTGYVSLDFDVPETSLININLSAYAATFSGEFTINKDNGLFYYEDAFILTTTGKQFLLDSGHYQVIYKDTYCNTRHSCITYATGYLAEGFGDTGTNGLYVWSPSQFDQKQYLRYNGANVIRKALMIYSPTSHFTGWAILSGTPSTNYYRIYQKSGGNGGTGLLDGTGGWYPKDDGGGSGTLPVGNFTALNYQGCIEDPSGQYVSKSQCEKNCQPGYDCVARVAGTTGLISSGFPVNFLNSANWVVYQSGITCGVTGGAAYALYSSTQKLAILRLVTSTCGVPAPWGWHLWYNTYAAAGQSGEAWAVIAKKQDVGQLTTGIWYSVLPSDTMITGAGFSSGIISSSSFECVQTIGGTYKTLSDCENSCLPQNIAYTMIY